MSEKCFPVPSLKNCDLDLVKVDLTVFIIIIVYYCYQLSNVVRTFILTQSNSMRNLLHFWLFGILTMGFVMTVILIAGLLSSKTSNLVYHLASILENCPFLFCSLYVVASFESTTAFGSFEVKLIKICSYLLFFVSSVFPVVYFLNNLAVFSISAVFMNLWGITLFVLSSLLFMYVTFRFFFSEGQIAEAYLGKKTQRNFQIGSCILYLLFVSKLCLIMINIIAPHSYMTIKFKTDSAFLTSYVVFYIISDIVSYAIPFTLLAFGVTTNINGDDSSSSTSFRDDHEEYIVHSNLTTPLRTEISK